MSIKNYFYIFIIFVFVAGLLFLPIPINNIWWREVFNTGHTILFLILPFVLYYPLKTRFSIPNKLFIYVYILLIGMLLGVCIEIMQSRLERDFSLNDVYRNFLGITSGLCLLAAFNLNRAHYKKTKSVYFMVAGAGLFFLGLMPLVKLSWHYIERNNAFPVIIDFDARWSESFVRLSNVEISKAVDINQRENNDLHDIQFNKGRYPGISIVESEPDWSNYHQLHFKIFSSYKCNKTLKLRIHDFSNNNDHVGRYIKKLNVRPGLNVYEIDLSGIKHGPHNRELDLTHIAALKLFSNELEEPLQFKLGNFYLE